MDGKISNFVLQKVGSFDQLACKEDGVQEWSFGQLACKEDEIEDGCCGKLCHLKKMEQENDLQV